MEGGGGVGQSAPWPQHVPHEHVVSEEEDEVGEAGGGESTEVFVAPDGPDGRVGVGVEGGGRESGGRRAHRIVLTCSGPHVADAVVHSVEHRLGWAHAGRRDTGEERLQRSDKQPTAHPLRGCTLCPVAALTDAPHLCCGCTSGSRAARR